MKAFELISRIFYKTGKAVIFLTLDKLQTGQSGIITAVGGMGALRNRLLDMGLIPKTKVTLRKTAPLGDPIEIYLRGYVLTIRKEEAREISVELCDKSNKNKIGDKNGNCFPADT